MFIFKTEKSVQVKNIKTAIANASSLSEMERLNQMLRTGQVPGGNQPQPGIQIILIGYGSVP